jgi:hypothetical protein
MTDTEYKLKAAIALYLQAEKVVQSTKENAEAVWLEAVKEKFGIEEGTVVKYKGKRYRVCRVTHYDSDFELKYSPNVYGNPQNKDGKFSIGERHLYGDWEIEKG